MDEVERLKNRIMGDILATHLCAVTALQTEQLEYKMYNLEVAFLKFNQDLSDMLERMKEKN